MKSFVLKSAKIVDASSPYHLQYKDIVIHNGVIHQIVDHYTKDASQDFDFEEVVLENLHISKGWFDSATCFGEPGHEDRELLSHGLLVAAKSGFTNLLLQPDFEKDIATKRDISFFDIVSQDHPVQLHITANLTTKSSSRSELTELHDLYQNGIKVFGDYKQSINNPKLLQIALDYTQQFGGIVQAFPQQKAMAAKGRINESPQTISLGLSGIPNLAEELQVQQDLSVLSYTGGNLHIPTISTAKAVSLIKQAKSKGLSVSCSVTPHHLFLNDSDIKDFNTNALVSPPLRDTSDQEVLIQACLDGVIDMVCTDHRPLCIEDKKVTLSQAKQGSIGLESCFGALNKILGLEPTVRLLTQAKQRFGIDSPSISVGSSVDITLFNPDIDYTFSTSDILSSQSNSIFLNKSLKGKTYGIVYKDQLILS